MKNKVFFYFLLLSILASSHHYAEATNLSDASAIQAFSSKLKPKRVRVITDNDMAFASKIKSIEAAKPGEDINMIYYIFSNDQSSSYMAHKLIKKAQDGHKVRLLVDYNYNYKKLDFFAMMEHFGEGNFKVRFYNRPTRNIIRDALYLTTPCPEEVKKAGKELNEELCVAEKTKIIDNLLKKEDGKYIDKNISNANNGQSGVFLSGLYAQDPVVMATAIMKGQNLDLSKLNAARSSDAEKDSEDLKNLRELLTIYFRSKLSSSIYTRMENKVKLGFASIMYGDAVSKVLDPINEILPATIRSDENRTLDWKYIYDYTHHKFLLVGDRYLQMGGRNIENSYHMRKNKLTEKYIFMDTDVWMELEGGGKEAQTSFFRLWNYKNMVATLDEVRQHAPNDYLVNFKKASKSCNKQHEGVLLKCISTQLSGKDKICGEEKVEYDKAKIFCKKNKEYSTKINECTQKEFLGEFKKLQDRVVEQYAISAEQFAQFETEYQFSKVNIKATGDKDIFEALFSSFKKDKDLPWSNVFEVDPNEPDFLMGYIENLPFSNNNNQLSKNYTKDEKHNPASGKYNPERNRGVPAFKDIEVNKNIHYLLIEGMKDTCRIAEERNEPMDIILHNAYFFPTGKVMKTFADMADGSIECGNVTVSILTNSIETTDLNVINIVGQYQMAQFFRYYDYMHSEEEPEESSCLFDFVNGMARRRANHYRGGGRGARFKYLEYKKKGENTSKNEEESCIVLKGEKEKKEEESGYSLHTKVSVLGDSIIIGSANMDMRSFLMDTNNGVFIRNAKGFMRDYVNFLTNLMDNKEIVQKDRGKYFSGLTKEKIDAINRKFADVMIRPKLEKKLGQEGYKHFIDELIIKMGRSWDLSEEIYDSFFKPKGAAKTFNELYKML